MENPKKDIRAQRLEILIRELILRKTDELSFDSADDFRREDDGRISIDNFGNENKNALGLYEQLLANVFMGELDDVFLSQSLLGIEGTEREEIMDLARKYMSLCFYDGDISYWADSIEGVHLSDLDLICMKLLDHYDFLLGLIKAGGEDVLKKLVPLQNTSLTGTTSIIDALRNIFPNDTILKDVLCTLWREDGPYHEFTDSQKKILLEFPRGIFYEEKGKIIEKIPAEELKNKLYQTHFGEVPEGNIPFEVFLKSFPNEESFERLVLDTHFAGYTYGGYTYKTK